MSVVVDFEHLHNMPVQPLDVDFTLPEAGWILCRVRPLHSAFEISCTYIWSPFERFLQWLEQIADGSCSATWCVDEEGSCARLHFFGGRESVDDQVDYLLHVRSSETLNRIFGVAVERRQLVDSFYRGFRAMAGSPEYAPREWDHHPQIHRLEEMEDDEYEAALHTHPYDGEPLRELRSPRVEAWLEEQAGPAAQLSLFPDLLRQPAR